MHSAQYYSISEAAQKLGVSAETLRRWDRAGKFEFGRTPGGQRVFTEEDIKRIELSFVPYHHQSIKPKQLQKIDKNHKKSNKSSEKADSKKSIQTYTPRSNGNFPQFFLAFLITALFIFGFSRTSYPKTLIEGLNNLDSKFVSSFFELDYKVASKGPYLRRLVQESVKNLSRNFEYENRIGQSYLKNSSTKTVSENSGYSISEVFDYKKAAQWLNNNLELSSNAAIINPPSVSGELSKSNNNAVLGIETLAPLVIEEEGPISSFLSDAGKTISGLGNLFKFSPISSFVIPTFQTSPQISQNLTAKDIESSGNLTVKGTAKVGKLVTGIIDPYLIENDGTVQSTLEIKSVGDIQLEPGSLNVNLTNSSLSNVNNITSSGTISGGSLNLSNNSTIAGNETIKGNSSIVGNLTLTGTINGNTLSSTSLIFSGSSPSIYPTTANTQISLNASGTGAINIGNSSTGDIYIGGGSTTGTYCLITNSNGSLNCASDITTGGNLHVNGGTIATSQTSFNLLNQTATTISFAGATTSLSIGSSTGTTTINNALTATGALTGSSTLSITGASTLTGAVTASSTLAVTGNSTLTGTLTANNNVTLGSSSSNTVAFNGSLTTSIIPKTTGSIDLGSSSLKFNNLYSNTINTASTNTSGQAIFTQNPASTAIADASVLINPTTVTNNTSALLGVAVGGVEKARIDNNGNLTLQGNLTVSGTTTQTGTLTANNFSSSGVTITGGTINGTSIGATTTSTGAFTTLSSSGATTLGTGSSLTNTFGSGSSSVNTIGSTTTPGALTLHGATTLDNTFTISGSNLTSLGGNLTVTGTSWTATPTISGLITATSGLTSNGTVTVAANQNLTLSSGTGTITQTYSNSSGTAATINTTNSASSGTTTVNALGVALTGTANSTGSNTLNAINLSNVTAATNNTFNGLNFGTGYNNYIASGTFNLTAAGAVSGATTITATGNINSSGGSLQTNGITRVDNSGNVTAGTGSFAGNVTPNADATYALGSSSVRWSTIYVSGDVNAGDVVFKNNFRLRERGGTGIDLLNPKGQVVASFDDQGNFWVKGEIRHGTGN